jgi:hypothetical protein
VLDDVTPLQRLADATSASGPTLFDVRPATRWVMWNRDSNVGERWYQAPNPPNGAIISYFLKSDAKDLSLTVTDKAGTVVRTIRNAPAAAGLNRTTWDLRHDPPAGQGVGPGGGGGFFGGGGSIAVLPGEYVVRLRVDGREVSRPVTVRVDPRVEITAADLQAQYDLAVQLQDLSTRATAMVARVDDLTRQLTALQQRIAPRRTLISGEGAGVAPTPESTDLAGAVKAALEKLKTLRDSKLARPLPGLGYRQFPRLQEEIRTVFGIVNGDPFPPTEGAKLRYQELVDETARLGAELNAVIGKEIGFINQSMAKMPYVQAETIK